MKNKKQATKVEASLKCKATAALQKQVAEELTEEDKPLEELLSDDKTQDTK